MHISDILIPLPFVTVMERDGKLVEDRPTTITKPGAALGASLLKKMVRASERYPVA